MSTQLKSVTYRSAKLEDLSRIVHFQISMAWETEKFKLNPDTVTLGSGRSVPKSYRGQYFVAESSGKIVGCLLTLPEWSDGETAKFGGFIASTWNRTFGVKVSTKGSTCT